MDWATIATVLGERVEQPVFVLDREGRIRLFNRAMEALLGWGRAQVEGVPWSRFSTEADESKARRPWWAEALRGALRSHDSTMITKGGALVLVRLELSLIGRSTNQALIATATDHWPLGLRGPSSEHEYDYVVSIAAGRFGILMRVSIAGEAMPGVDSRRPCYRTLYGLERPCTDCPLLSPADTWPRKVVRSRESGRPPPDDLLFELTTATLLGEGQVRVRTRTFTTTDLSMIHEVKIDQAANRAHLSPREREVLRYMLLGRSNDDIAALAGIAVRTVKHHQARLLDKLGADSRADLVRVLF